MILALAVLGLLGAGTLPDDPSAALLKEARSAWSHGDKATAGVCLEAWAGLERRRDLPEGLEAPAAAAIREMERRGGIEVYTSRLPDRLRVGIHDPKGLTGRAQAFGQTGDGKLIQLGRLEAEQEGRLDFRLPAPDITVVIDLYGRGCGKDLLLRRSIIVPVEPKLPSAPDPVRSAARIVTGTVPPATAPPEETALVPWWLIAGGVVAAGFVGAAVWQETR